MVLVSNHSVNINDKFDNSKENSPEKGRKGKYDLEVREKLEKK